MENKTWIEELRREQIKNSARNPGLAAMMSFFVMGLGQIYAGHVDRGIFLLALHVGGVCSGLSLYFKGQLYQSLIPIIGIEVMVVFVYIISVVLILLWIYNIKDAYHLSLFSSYRDWFEVERVLLPILESQPNKLLEHSVSSHDNTNDKEISEQVPTNNKKEIPSTIATNRTKVAEIEDTEVAEITKVILPEDEEVIDTKEHSDNPVKGKVIYFSDIDYSMSTPKQSWKIYVGFLMILILVGTWFQKGNKNSLQNSSSIFVMSADLPSKNTLENIKSFRQAQSTKETKSRFHSITPMPTTKHINQQTSLPKTIVKSSQTANSILNEGLSLLGDGNTLQAIKKFKVALQKSNPTKEVWKQILNAFYRAENVTEYENYLRVYLNDFTQDSEEWQNLGKLLYDKKQYAKASKAFTIAIKIKPDSVRANFLLGAIYIDLKLYKEALKHLYLALETDPLNIEVNRAIAISLSATKQKEKAIEHLNRILTIQPEDEDAINLLAQLKQDISYRNSNTTKLGNQEGIIFVQGKKVPVLITKDAKINYNIPSTKSRNILTNDKQLFSGVEIINATSSSSKIITNSLTSLLYEAPTKTSKTKISKPRQKISADVIKPIKVGAQNEAIVSPKSENKTRQIKQKKNIAKRKFKLNKNAGISELELTRKLIPASRKPLRDSIAIEHNTNLEVNLNKLLEQGFNKYSQGKLEASLSLYLKYLKARKNANAYDMVGIIFSKLNMKEDAFEASLHAYKMGCKGYSTLSRLGNLAIKTKKNKEAEFYLHSALKIKPNRIDTRILYARSLATNGKKEQALKELRNLMNQRQGSYSIKQKIKSEISKINLLN